MDNYAVDNTKALDTKGFVNTADTYYVIKHNVYLIKNTSHLILQ